MNMKGSLRVPREILESAVEYVHEETIPKLVETCAKDVIVICRVGNRSLLAGRTLQPMGYAQLYSLTTGLRRWNDCEQPLETRDGDSVVPEASDDYFAPRTSEDQIGPEG